MGNINDLRDDVSPNATVSWQTTAPDESARSLIARIKHLLVDPEGYGYADAILRGMLDTLQRTGRATHGQVNAVDRITDNPGRTSRSRRQGGW